MRLFYRQIDALKLNYYLRNYFDKQYNFYFALFMAFFLVTACGTKEKPNKNKPDSSFEDQNNENAYVKHSSDIDIELNDNEHVASVSIEKTNNYDGDYCADITYYNPNTGTHSEYRLIVEVQDNNLIKINFPQGWMDEDEFGNEELDEDGFVEFDSNAGYHYTVQITTTSISDCFNNLIHPVQCIGTTIEGARCRHLTDNPNQLCWQHQNQEVSDPKDDEHQDENNFDIDQDNNDEPNQNDEDDPNPQ